MPPDSVTTMSSVSKDMPKPSEPCVPELDSRLDAPESPPEISSEQDVDVKDGATVTVSASGTGGGGSASSPSRKRKRENYIDWDSYFMGVAFLSAMRSKDPSTQVGACIVDQDNRIVGIGYNGFPRGCSDDELPWARESELTGERGGLDTKYPYVCHAEVNAILNMNIATAKGCRMYVALFPCNECAKVIIQSGVREVVYMSDKYHDHPSMIASRRMFDLAGIVINFSDV